MQGRYAVALLSRRRASFDELEREIIAARRGFECDVGAAESVSAAFAAIRAELGEVEVILYNAGSGVFADVETSLP